MLILDSMEYATDSAARAAWPSTYSSNIISGGSASASSEYNIEYLAACAVDGNDATRWSGNNTDPFPYWWQYDLGSGTQKKVNKLRILTYTWTTYTFLKDFILKGSNNGTDWTDIYTGQAANVSDGTWQTFTFVNTNSYRYYRIHITSTYYGEGGNYVTFYEVQMMEGYGSITAYSESTIKQHGSYSAKIVALQTSSLNETLTKTCSPTWNLSGQTSFKFDVRSNRTGSNFKIGIHDSGGTTTEVTPNIASADTWQEVTLDLSAVSDANKDAIDSIIYTQLNADAKTTVYMDYLIADNVAWPEAKYVYHGVDRGDGVTGTLHASTISAAAGAGSDLSAALLKNGETVDDVAGSYAGGGIAVGDIVIAQYVLEGHKNYVGGDDGTYHEAQTSEVNSGILFGASSGLTGTYSPGGTYAEGEAAQLATDQAAVLAKAGSIKDDTTILGQAGTYDFTAAIAAGYASGEIAGQAAQLITDKAAVDAAKASIKDDTTILTIAGTLDMELYVLISALPDKHYLYYTINRGDGIKGTLRASNIHTAAGAPGVNLLTDILKKDSIVDDITGTYEGEGSGDYPDPDNVLECDTTDGVSGTYHEAAAVEVASGVIFGPSSSYIGTYGADSPGDNTVFGDALSELINSDLGADAIYTPVSGTAKSVRVFIDRNTNLQPTGFDAQVFERGTSIEALLADLVAEPNRGDTFLVAGITYTVQTIEDNDDYIVRMVCT